MRYSRPFWRWSPSSIEIVCLIAGLLLVFWYSWILEDAYVYFRYVDNWIIFGQGLVWNPGEYVEGFSSPLWVLFLGALRALHLDYWLIVRNTGLLGFAIFWYLVCLINRGLTPAGRTGPSYNVPLIYLSFSYGVTCYFTAGIETPLISIAAAVYAAGILWPRSRILQVLLGLTPLLRPELVFPLLLFLIWANFFRRARPFAALIVFILTSGAYGIFRVWYYADFFPNTLYLKNATLPLQGLYYIYDTIITYFTIPYLTGCLIAYWILRRHGRPLCRRGERLAMVILALSVTAYIVKIGGDSRHFRYLNFPYILVVLATGGLIEEVSATLPRVIRERYVPVFLLLFGFCVALCYPRQLQQHPMFHSRFGFGHNTFLKIHDSALHRLNHSPRWYSFSSFLGYDRARKRFAVGYLDDESVEPGVLDEVPWATAKSHLFSDPLISDALCQLAYLHPASPVIHSLGLTDPFLARMEMPIDRPGHKWGLLPLSRDLLQIRSEYGFVRGAFDEAIVRGTAPLWVPANINSLRRIEQKAYNNHNFLENFASALSPPAWIKLKTH